MKYRKLNMSYSGVIFHTLSSCYANSFREKVRALKFDSRSVGNNTPLEVYSIRIWPLGSANYCDELDK